jgi:hypothetical protein
MSKKKLPRNNRGRDSMSQPQQMSLFNQENNPNHQLDKYHDILRKKKGGSALRRVR